jgi:3-oxoacyl-[acyl-carrier protein] reductase
VPGNSPAAFAHLTGKTALVTGASSGIGRAIALELARAGSAVIVHFARSQDRAEQVAEEIRQLGQPAWTVGQSFEQANFPQFVDRVWNDCAPVDIWINNAGADLLTGDAAKLPFSRKLELLWQVDVLGTVELSRAVLQRMQQTGKPDGKTILNIGWDQADRGMDGDSAELFSTAKNAIMGFTRSLAMNAAPEIRVNCIAPGWIRTAWGDQASTEWQTRVLHETPLKRWGTPEDIARLARFLVSDEAAFITGQVINSNGGAVR